jgi:hypothetical protein
VRKKRHGTRLALASLCLAALPALAGELPLTTEARKAASVNAGVIERSAGVDVQGGDSGPESLGGALYSPFSTAFDPAAAKPYAYAYATPARPKEDEEIPGLVATTLSALIAAGVLVALVRVLVAS